MNQMTGQVSTFQKNTTHFTKKYLGALTKEVVFLGNNTEAFLK